MDSNILYETVEDDDTNAFVEKYDRKHDDKCDDNNVHENVQDDDGTSKKWQLLHL